MSNNSRKDGEYIQSNFEYIDGEMDKLRAKVDGAINYCQNNDPKVQSIKEDNLLYSKLNNIFDNYSLAQKTLMEKLNREIEFVRYAGETYRKLDKEIEGNAEKL